MSSTGSLAAKPQPPSVSAAGRFGLVAVLGATLAQQGTDLGNIQVPAFAGGPLVIAAQRGFGLDSLAHFRSVTPANGSACSRAAGSHSPISIPDVREDPSFARHRSIAAVAGFTSVQSTPLRAEDGTLLGVFSSHFRFVRTWKQSYRDNLQSSAGYLAAIVERLTAR